jgi:hypothetical protein
VPNNSDNGHIRVQGERATSALQRAVTPAAAAPSATQFLSLDTSK